MFCFDGKKKATYFPVKRKPPTFRKWLAFCDLGGARTLDPLIKSQLLSSVIKSVAFNDNQLSYGTLEVGNSRRFYLLFPFD